MTLDLGVLIPQVLPNVSSSERDVPGTHVGVQVPFRPFPVNVVGTLFSGYPAAPSLTSVTAFIREGGLQFSSGRGVPCSGQGHLRTQAERHATLFNTQLPRSPPAAPAVAVRGRGRVGRARASTGETSYGPGPMRSLTSTGEHGCVEQQRSLGNADDCLRGAGDRGEAFRTAVP